MNLEARVFIVFILYTFGMWLIFEWIDKENKNKRK